MNRRIAVRAIIIHDDRLLCVRQKHYAGNDFNNVTDFWCLPGGGVDNHEALLTALDREIIEELGVKPVIGNLLYVQQFIDGDTEHLEFFFHVMNPVDYQAIDLIKTSHGAAEIAELAFINPAAEKIMPIFLSRENIFVQAQANQPVTFFSFF